MPAEVQHLEITDGYNLFLFNVVNPCQRGDLLMLDNVLAAHGRKPFGGPRRVLVAMSG